MRNPRVVRRALPLLVCVILALGGVSSVPAQESPADTGPVNVWLTTGDRSRLLEAQPSLQFGAEQGGGPVVEVNEQHRYQEMDGFGAAMTDSSVAWMRRRESSTACKPCRPARRRRTPRPTAPVSKAASSGRRWPRGAPGHGGSGGCLPALAPGRSAPTPAAPRRSRASARTHAQRPGASPPRSGAGRAAGREPFAAGARHTPALRSHATIQEEGG